MNTTVEDRIAPEMFATHDWDWSNELPKCRKCERCPIGLGFWGDDNWRNTHTDYLKPCEGNKGE